MICVLPPYSTTNNTTEEGESLYSKIHQRNKLNYPFYTNKKAVSNDTAKYLSKNHLTLFQYSQYALLWKHLRLVLAKN